MGPSWLKTQKKSLLKDIKSETVGDVFLNLWRNLERWVFFRHWTWLRETDGKRFSVLQETIDFLKGLCSFFFFFFLFFGNWSVVVSSQILRSFPTFLRRQRCAWLSGKWDGTMDRHGEVGRASISVVSLQLSGLTGRERRGERWLGVARQISRCCCNTPC